MLEALTRAVSRARSVNHKRTYFIADALTDKCCVGAACDDWGISTLRCAYADTGYVSNVGFRALPDGESLDYRRSHFRLAPLECRAARTAGNVVVAGGQHRKHILRLHGELDLNPKGRGCPNTV